MVYDYDDFGNIYRARRYSGIYTSVAAASASSNLVSTETYSYGDSEWKDLLTAYNGTAITYDSIGNPLTYYNGLNSYTLSWDNGRQLVSAQAGDKNISFEYDESGKREIKQILAEKFTAKYRYDGDSLVEMTRGGTNVGSSSGRYIFLYDESGLPYAVEFIPSGSTTATRYYYMVNAQGDVMCLMDASNNLVARYAYDAWGKLLGVFDANNTAITDANHIANVNPLRYRSYIYDPETGFYYCGSRYYDPQMRRFINADGYVSTGQGILGHNMFAYCNNNPVNYYDPSGMRCICLTQRVRPGHVCTDDNTIVKKSPKSEPCPPLEPLEMVYGGDLTEDQEVLVATIVAEATVTAQGNPVSWQGRQAMANVALNRVGDREWAEYGSVSEICEFTGFDGYGNGDYQACMNYLNNRDRSNATYESIIWDVMSAYCSDITNGCQLYFTPAAMTNESKIPDWNFSILTEEVISGVDPYYEGRFYRYK